MRRLLLFVCLVAVVRPLFGEVRLDELTAAEKDGKVSVQFHLGGVFENEEIAKKLQGGLPTLFAFEVQLVRKRHNWFDKTLASHWIEVAATFNSLTREYLLNYRRDEKLVFSETYRDYEKLKVAMTRIEENDLFDTPPGRLEGHRVRVRSEVRSELIFYIVPRRVGTGWRTCHIDPAEGDS